MRSMYFLSILLVFIIGTVKMQAQTEVIVSQKNRQTEFEKLYNQVETAEESFQKSFENDKMLKSLKDPAKSLIKKHHNDVCQAYDEVVKLLQKQFSDREDTIMIFRFFSNAEESLFTDSTLIKRGLDKKLTGTFLVQYETISQIRETSLAVLEIEDVINERIAQKIEKGWDDDKLKTVISLEIEKAMNNEVFDQIEIIKRLDTSFLSDKQNEYYLNVLRRYDEIYRTYF